MRIALRDIVGTLIVMAILAFFGTWAMHVAFAGHVIEDFDGNIPAGAICDETIIGGDGHVSGDYAFGIFREFKGTTFASWIIVYTHGEDIFIDPDDPKYQAGRSMWDRMTKCKLPPPPTTTTLASSTTTSRPSTSTSSTIPTSTTVPSTTTTVPTSTTSSSTTTTTGATTTSSSLSVPSTSSTTVSVPPTTTTSGTPTTVVDPPLPTPSTVPEPPTAETPEGPIEAGGGAMADTGWRSGWPWIFGGLFWVLVAAFWLAVTRGGDIDDE